ncbi:hypothetical protein [Leptolyngbya sp. FACHB-261]|uniref:hypothetical protein n=1 Tax=Leptolyngbya sp. FACHB-261 TaxID=2692806 RepID=UPI0016855F7D|nr:hypothetical protein [Leptolyngbya sp. FACHB-261]MBD2102962.1 hypothetical protein [Leptolyngbya sp. FACHB-261]
MKTTNLTPAQIRLALWDTITRDLNLQSVSKLILLIIANFTNPRSRTARIPLSLIVLKSGLHHSDVNRQMAVLETSGWVEKILVPAEAEQRSITLYNLSAQLLRLALQQQPDP